MFPAKSKIPNVGPTHRRSRIGGHETVIHQVTFPYCSENHKLLQSDRTWVTTNKFRIADFEIRSKLTYIYLEIWHGVSFISISACPKLTRKEET